MQKREGKDLEKRIDPGTQQEIFFTMKVYAVKSDDGFQSLKYSIDFHPPFESNTSAIAPFASPIVPANAPVFKRIFDNVQEVFKFIADPTGYRPGKNEPKAWRTKQQKDLAKAIKLSKGAINHITYELNSPPLLSVGTTFMATGNGDMRPPRA